MLELTTKTIREKVNEEFEKKTKDNKCAHVKLDINLEQIPKDEFLVISVTEQQDNTFDGVILKKSSINNQEYLNLRTAMEDALLIAKNAKNWQSEHDIGILCINSI